MASSTRSIDWHGAFAELSFIPVASNWLELLASRLAQPLMFISSLYIIAETTVPGAASWSLWLDVATKTVMSLAPEIILPGCFQQAQQAEQASKERKARLLFLLFGLCIFLLAVTLASFIWHFAGVITGIILFVRCGVGVAYTVILKIDKEEQGNQAAPPAMPSAEDLAAQITQIVRSELQAAIAQSRQNAAHTAVQEVAQPPAPIEISTAQPTPRPALAQQATATTLRKESTTDPVLAAMVSAQADDDAKTRVFRLLDACRERREPAPTLGGIIELCGVAKNTASKYRREYREQQGGAQ